MPALLVWIVWLNAFGMFRDPVLDVFSMYPKRWNLKTEPKHRLCSTLPMFSLFDSNGRLIICSWFSFIIWIKANIDPIWHAVIIWYILCCMFIVKLQSTCIMIILILNRIFVYFWDYIYLYTLFVRIMNHPTWRRKANDSLRLILLANFIN